MDQSLGRRARHFSRLAGFNSNHLLNFDRDARCLVCGVKLALVRHNQHSISHWIAHSQRRPTTLLFLCGAHLPHSRHSD